MIFNTILLAALTIWSSIKCEPPVNSYLPPNNDASRPDSQYGPPGSGNGGSRSGRPQFGVGDNGNPQDSYSPSEQFGRQNSLDTQYGPPPQQSFGQSSGQSQSPTQRSSNQARGGSVPSPQYGAPNRINNRGLAGLSKNPSDGSFTGNSDNGLGSFGGSGQIPRTSYGPPATGSAQSNSGFSTLEQGSNQRSAPSRAPDTSYGTPSFGTSNGSRNRQSSGGSPSSSYGAPDFNGNGRQGVGTSGFNGESDEPAKYEFSYDVDDAQTGTKFGHSEQRDGDLTTGEYNVVLPDGRKQVVEYEAGLQGYKPQIRYEGQANGGNGAGSQFGGQVQGVNEGYPRGGPQTSNFQDNNNDNGFHQPGQSGSSNGYQNGPRSQQDSANGYSAGEPNNDRNRGRSRNGFGGLQGERDFSNGYSSGRPSNNVFGRNGLSSGGSQQNGYQGRGSQGGEQGYPSAGPQNGGQGYSEGKKQGNSGGLGSQLEGSQGGEGEGYPSGRPDGSRGTGY